MAIIRRRFWLTNISNKREFEVLQALYANIHHAAFGVFIVLSLFLWIGHILDDTRFVSRRFRVRLSDNSRSIRMNRFIHPLCQDAGINRSGQPAFHASG